MHAHLERVLIDYADQTKVCWASDSGKAVSECWCAQCAEGRLLYPIALNTSKTLERKDYMIQSYIDLKNKARDFIQASIDREEWEQSELAEPFWEELAEMFCLDLKRTKEIEIRVTITYSGTVTVPHDCDAESDLDIEGLSNEITVNYGGQEIEDQWVTFEGQEIEEY